MLTKVVILFVALYAQSGYIRAYSIPLPPLFTSTHQSHGKGYGGSHDGHHEDLRYHGPTAVPHVLHNGHIADTHEVAAAKAEHFAAVSKAQVHSGRYAEEHQAYSDGHSHGDLRYHGPTAVPHVLHDGHIADTHEVAAAKAEHFAAVSKAQVHSGRYAEEHKAYSDGHSHGDLRYHGPTAIPHVLHDGHIADTHEVAAAKAEHFAAVSKAQVHSGRYAEEHQAYSDGHSHGDLRYHGPTAIPHVLHDGHIADTQEVAAAKAEHFAAVSKAQSGSEYLHGGYSGTQHGYLHGGEHGGYSGAQHGHHHASYHQTPRVLHSGYLADTHEVAVAKQQHFHALSQASHTSHVHYHH